MGNAATDFQARAMRRLEACKAEVLLQRTTATAGTGKPPRLDYVGTLLTWWNSLPPKLRMHPWALETIIAAAFTDPQRRPSGWRVGQALRRLGWSSKRDFTSAGCNRRQWLPPFPENDLNL